MMKFCPILSLPRPRFSEIKYDECSWQDQTNALKKNVTSITAYTEQTITMDSGSILLLQKYS
jgi:hypothetical protein